MYIIEGFIILIIYIELFIDVYLHVQSNLSIIVGRTFEVHHFIS